MSSQRILSTLQAYRDSAALHTAIGLDLFTRISQGNHTVTGLAEELGIPSRGLRILCCYLAASGLITRQGDELQLADDAATFLDKKSPAYLGSAASVLHSPTLLHNFERLTESVRAGSSTDAPAGLPAWFDLTRGVTNAAETAEAFADAVTFNDSNQPLKILDVSAGDGRYGIALAEKYPEAIIVALDTPDAIKIAQVNASQAKLGTRYQNIPGDSLTAPLGYEYDAAVIGGSLHRFHSSQISALLVRLHDALKKSGQLLIVDSLLDEEVGNEIEFAGLRLNMLAATSKGDIFSLANVKDMLAASGFSRVESQSLPSARSILVTARPQ